MTPYKNSYNEFDSSKYMAARGRGQLPLGTYIRNLKHLLCNQWQELKQFGKNDS